MVRFPLEPLCEAELLGILTVKAMLAIQCTCFLVHVSGASGICSVKCAKVTELLMSQAHERLQCHQLITHHQPASPQEEDNSKNVYHAGREHTIPGPEQHWLPYKQLDLPPGLGLGQGPLKQSTQKSAQQQSEGQRAESRESRSGGGRRTQLYNRPVSCPQGSLCVHTHTQSLED